MIEILAFITDTLWPLILSIGAVLLLFGGTVLVHELGHFLTAKWFGLRIDAFSIGMGPALWQKTVNGVVYKISLLPIGGYVALPQMDITGSAFENEDAAKGVLEPIAPYKRIIIAIAGPFMNVLAAFILATIVWVVGKPADPGPGPALVGTVEMETPAYEAGLREGDLIRKINNDRIKFWADVQISSMLNDNINMQVIRENEVVNLYDIPTELNSLGFRQILGVYPIESDLLFIEAFSISPDSPAQRAGMLDHDRLISINGKDINESTVFINEVQGAEGEAVTIVVQAKGSDETRTIQVAPEWNEDHQQWLVGIMLQGEFETVHPTPLSQIDYFQGSIFRTLKAFTRRQEVKKAAQGVGGPVMILNGMHTQVKMHPMQALWFTALININLAIINLLPLIILDGGHIMVALFEIITGRKIYPKLIMAMANAMVVILITTMVYLSFRDVVLIRKLNHSFDEPVAAETATPEADAPEATDTTETDAVMP
ncbi:RIP metalloprotease RseP [Kiritimatiellota bacterium B12222]|nr:RIP metalloprotease RseP [Kiritimatiellota bacterium B12222]